MSRKLMILTLVTALASLASQAVAADDANQQTTERAFGVFKKYCYKCHGQAFEVEGFDVLNHKILTNKDSGYIVPGKPDESEIWKRVGIKNSMPPKKITERPTDEEKAILKKWIEAGAPSLPIAADSPGKGAREYRSCKDVLTAIRDYQRKCVVEDRPYQRFFTLTHLHNNPATTDRELRLFKAGLSKLVNSLSWEKEIVVPKPVDKEETIFVVDVRELGWDKRDLWSELLGVYPYGLTHEFDRDKAVRSLSEEIVGLANCDVPYVRADWFVNAASRPPLYHTMLELPDNARALETRLKVNVKRNFESGRLSRAGFANSGISAQNRMVERHAASYGAFWKSYDFKPRNARSNLFQYPLGPNFPGSAYERQAFTQDGGEIIFNLPNGLQAYYLVDKNDRRIDEGPTDVVGDSTKAAGSTAIVNGLSCMSCHSVGMKPFKDTVRDGTAVNGPAGVKVAQLYRDQKDNDKFIKQDGDRFMRAVERATGPFLRIGADKDLDLRRVDEPVRTLADLYQRDLGPAEVAFELDIADPKELQTMARTNRDLRSAGLGPLADGKTIKREDWEIIKGTSIFQDVARKLGKGTPKFGAIKRN